ncbi:MAG TPA: Trp biosynthesis-associated membrane protein [Homoserinimonas sp.]|nr:Trp biosynthesis-associated membrane protein [Homoserinimonas sp.]
MNRAWKPVSLIASILLSALTLLSWTMTWFVVSLGGAESSRPAISVTGEVAAPALAALGLAGLALVAALAIAGPLFRIALGVLQAAIGACIGWSAWSAITDPVAASAPLVTETTGITGGQSVEALVDAAAATPWPGITLAISALIFLTGVFIVVTARRWPTAASRYQAVRFDDTDAPRSAVSDWDSLSDGSDPTSR